MNVVGVVFEAHSIARSMKLRHTTYYAKNKVDEKPWIAHVPRFHSLAVDGFRMVKERPQIKYVSFHGLFVEQGWEH